ncbi:helix-turn-helix domain-containing protein [Fusicatenibacter saccharivorans]
MTFTLKKAEHLLSDTTASISSIALQLGFNNRTHFYKIFKGKYGITPGEYREKLR